MALPLDHLSLNVPTLAEAERWFLALTGVALARSPGDPHHARLYFDRSYLELRETGAPGPWSASLWFLRYPDPEQLRTGLAERGLAAEGPTHYRGVDGEWEEFHPRELLDPRCRPLLIRRLTPVDVARNWPPPAPPSPLLGRVRLGAVVLEVEDSAIAAARLEALIGRPATPIALAENGSRASSRFDLRLDGGERVILVAGPGAPRIAGFALSVERTEPAIASAATARERPPFAARGEHWVQPPGRRLWVGVLRT